MRSSLTSVKPVTAAGVLRFWEPTQNFVVLGYANQVDREVNRDFCREHHIPILRRCSGGGTVLQGPGCLNYSLILPIDSAAPLASISGTNEYVLQRHVRVLHALLGAPVAKQGDTDLTIGGLKFSGNAQRRRKNFLLFHGSFLLHTDIDLIERVLPLPSRQPDYRVSRSHSSFLVNLKVPAYLLKTGLINAWAAAETLSHLPLDQISLLAREKYREEAWNYKF